MGGKALNKYGVFTERKNTEEFLRIGEELKDRILWDFDGPNQDIFGEIVTCYRTKPDHGDLDLLVHVPEGVQIDWRMYIMNAFKPNAININSGVYSFDYQGFQIDIIPIPAAQWNTATVYFSYDPLGNIMGKTYHKFNLSYGWEGLFYKYRNSHGTNSANILLSTDVRRIYEFGGYDYDRYLNGFDTLEEIFRFCIDSKYFDVEMFQMENLNSIDKKRNRKRGSYHLFLNYLKDNGIDTKFEFNRDKEYYLLDIDNAFPEANLMDKLHDLQVKDEMQQAIAEKFNGEVIMEWIPGISGKELGAAIGKFKQHLDDNFNMFILNSEIDEIRHRFMMVYNNG